MSNQVRRVCRLLGVLCAVARPRLRACGHGGRLAAAATASFGVVQDEKGHAEWRSARPWADTNISPFSLRLIKSIRVCARWKEEIKGYSILALIWAFDLKAAKYRTECRKVEKCILTLFWRKKKRFFLKLHHSRSMASIPKVKCLFVRVSFKLSQMVSYWG